LKNPKQQQALIEKRERQRVEGAVAMREYLESEEATRRKTKRLREMRLAKEASETQDAN
jgi:hypothetical protein